MPTTITDQDLIFAFREGQSTQCFQLLYERYHRQIYRHCLRMTKDQNTAQDFTHDIFLKLFEKQSSFQQKAQLSTWLYTITHNYCLDQIRLAKRLPSERLSAELEHIAADEPTDLVDERIIGVAWQTLSPQTKRLLLLKYEQGLSYQAISSQLNLTISTLKMRLLRARRVLQRRYYHLVTS